MSGAAEVWGRVLSQMKNSVAKGEHYDRLLEEFIAKGGDLSRCPFDTDDYKYRAPPYRKLESEAEWEREYQEIISRKK